MPRLGSVVLLATSAFLAAVLLSAAGQLALDKSAFPSAHDAQIAPVTTKTSTAILEDKFVHVFMPPVQLQVLLNQIADTVSLGKGSRARLATVWALLLESLTDLGTNVNSIPQLSRSLVSSTYTAGKHMWQVDGAANVVLLLVAVYIVTGLAAWRYATHAALPKITANGFNHAPVLQQPVQHPQAPLAAAAAAPEAAQEPAPAPEPGLETEAEPAPAPLIPNGLCQNLAAVQARMAVAAPAPGVTNANFFPLITAAAHPGVRTALENRSVDDVAQRLDYVRHVEMISRMPGLKFTEVPNVHTEDENTMQRRKRRVIALALVLLYHITDVQAQMLRDVVNSSVVRLQTGTNGFRERCNRLYRAKKHSDEWIRVNAVVQGVFEGVGGYKDLKNVITAAIIVAGLLLDRMVE